MAAAIVVDLVVGQGRSGESRARPMAANCSDLEGCRDCAFYSVPQPWL